MTRADRKALEACVELAEREPMRKQQLAGFRHDRRPWDEIALFACTIVQSKSMNLRPWQVAPCDAAGEPTHPKDVYMAEYRKARAVVEHMLKLGLSPYVADPLAEIRRAEEALRHQAPTLRVVSPDNEPPAAA
jgi:hypothetical protein